LNDPENKTNQLEQNDNIEKWKPNKIPKIIIENGIGDVKIEYDTYRITTHHGCDNKPKVRVQVRIACTCVELFELQNFPFDEQDLSISFYEDTGIDKWVFAPEQRSEVPTLKDAWINVMQKHFVAPEWTRGPILAEISETTGLNSKGGKKYSTLTIRIKMKRTWRSYRNIIWPMMILTALSLFVFAIDITDIASRLGYLVTLLLTIVAFQNSVHDQLPDLPIMTLLDKFVMVSFGFTTTVIGQTLFLTLNDYNDTHDEISLIIFILSWIGIHTFMFYYVRSCKAQELKKYKQTSVELASSETADALITHEFQTKLTWEDKKNKGPKGETITKPMLVFSEEKIDFS